MKTASQKQEADGAKLFGGRVTPASGAFWHRKGDVRTTDLLMEMKQTDKGSISISKRVWEKIRREALLDGRMPVLALQIQDRDLVVLDREDFLALICSEPERGVGEGGVP
jgi:hypothetical protein